MGVLLGLIIAAIAGVMVAGDANKRGMSGMGWGWGVFLLLIVFLPLYLICRKPIVADEPVSREETMKCSYCAETILKAAKVCKHCGRDVA